MHATAVGTEAHLTASIGRTRTTGRESAFNLSMFTRLAEAGLPARAAGACGSISWSIIWALPNPRGLASCLILSLLAGRGVALIPFLLRHRASRSGLPGGPGTSPSSADACNGAG